jgi:monoamine oxidase
MLNRRKFLKKTGQFAPVLLAAPGTLISACEKTTTQRAKNKSIIIVGAGIAGIHAAQLMLDEGATVTVLEASSRWGGRIRALNSFADFPIELGAEEIHGQKTAWYDLVKASGAKFASGAEEDYYFMGNQLRSATAIEDIPAAQTVFDLVEKIERNQGSDTSVADMALAAGVTTAWMPLANALIGNEHGTSNTRINAKGVGREDDLWTAGEQNFTVADKSYEQIIEQHYSKAIATIQMGLPVTQIDYAGTVVTVTTLNGQTYSADWVLVTVPLPILQAGTIDFVPALPASKVEAAQKIGMDRGMKVILKFTERFWSEDMGSLYGSGPVPEYWFTSKGRGNQLILTAFVMGEAADLLSGMTESTAISTVLDDLDQIFGGTVASDRYVDGRVMDWSKMPYIRGAYSYATRADGLDFRKKLAEPLGDRVFFAGEATHTEGHNSTVHGALETGERAVEEMLG